MRILSLLTLLVTLSAARADVVTEWNHLALDLIRDRGTSPPGAARNLAILHLAIHDAVHGIGDEYEPYLTTGKVPKSASQEAAAAAAGRDVLVQLYPMDAALIET